MKPTEAERRYLDRVKYEGRPLFLEQLGPVDVGVSCVSAGWLCPNGPFMYDITLKGLAAIGERQ